MLDRRNHSPHIFCRVRRFWVDSQVEQESWEGAMNDAQVDVAGAVTETAPTWGSWLQGVWDRLLNEGDPSEGTPVQFGLGAVLLLQALAAGALSLLVCLDLAGVFILFIGTVAAMFWRVAATDARRRRVFADLLAGVLMPISCVLFDPGILRDSALGHVVIAAILVQIAMLLACQLTPRGLPSVSAFFAGSLSVGFLLAIGIGIAILPMTLLGMLLLVGFLGTMPFFTAVVYLRNVISAVRIARTGSPDWLTRPMFIVGVVVAVGLPLVLHQAFGTQIANYLHSLPNFGTRWL